MILETHACANANVVVLHTATHRNGIEEIRREDIAKNMRRIGKVMLTHLCLNESMTDYCSTAAHAGLERPAKRNWRAAGSQGRRFDGRVAKRAGSCAVLAVSEMNEDGLGREGKSATLKGQDQSLSAPNLCARRRV